MNATETVGDLDLLHRYARDRAEDAFAELVHRHVDLVYSAALRQVRSPQLAEEVAQSTFTDLACNAQRLASDTILTAWLYQVTRRTAIDVVRREARRQLREQIATEMNAMNATTEDWIQILPHLDDAMDELDSTDRTAVLLRYFENKSLREVGQQLGVSDDAAQKRVSRAVERLREFFAKRDVTIGTSGLVVAITANAVQAAPVGLALTISAAALTGTTLVTTATVTATKAIAMTTLQKTVITATIAALAGVGIYETRQASQFCDQVQMLQQQQDAMATQLAHLSAENQRLSNQLTQASPPRSLTAEQFAELLKLRGRAQLNAREIADLKSTLAQNSDKVPESVAKIMNQLLTQRTTDEQQIQKSIATGKRNRMTQKLGLSTEQQQQVQDILLANVDVRADLEVAHVTGTLTSEDVARREKLSAEEDRSLAALLTPDQVAAYEQMKSDETASSRRNWVGYETFVMKNALKLSDEQARQISEVLTGLKTGEGGQGITYFVNSKDQLEIRLHALEAVLTSEQLKAYRKMKTEEIEQQNQIGKVVKAFKH